MTRTILVIDDEPDLRAIARVAIEVIGGWSMLEAASGDEAVAAARASRPDAVLLDHLLGGEDGLDVAARLRAEEGLGSVPILMLSASLSIPASEHVDGFLAKPFNPRTLADEVAAAAGWIS
ncbi:response regulator [Demequina capsici]|uniref:Response regulator n=1 Tax=Demequina capsici TaxID=3075620 RepID=A0AA96F9R6_9MICO|nr:response regulator [Demequina sp. OYTSA14]WNM24686.1 response regulator [Demequina sp. OYTSA14]